MASRGRGSRNSVKGDNALHVFPWQPLMSRTGLRRNAVYLVRPDGYVALADPDAIASKLEAYLDGRVLRPGAPLGNERDH
jgi:hypothetical protein